MYNIKLLIANTYVEEVSQISGFTENLTSDGSSGNTNIVGVQKAVHRASTVLDGDGFAVGLVSGGLLGVVLGLALATVVVAANARNPEVGATSVEDNTERLAGGTNGDVTDVFDLDCGLAKKIFLKILI